MLIAYIAFSDKNCHAVCQPMFNINSSSRRQEYSISTSELLMSQFMLVMSQQFTITVADPAMGGQGGRPPPLTKI